ncbi:hypothetical protein [Microbacterium hydrocarbonoxydans]|uniref:hypothetical protein n=1 Tax=Microbacterium hydrocarbonoxydans TaxID=273678 RepID=UPI00203DB008|nr:hypothetical protein [Microbacterium hydrocarbonoxydans]MCM3781031.1 hypothetical protein [Microbacterium hydrocarbonoxydans]
MDVFERVREVNTGVSITDERIAGARARLLEGIDAGMMTARKRVSRRPMFLIAGAVAGVAAATATVMVVGQLTTPDPRVEAVPARDSGALPVPASSPLPMPTPTPETAAQVLRGAATAAESYQAPALAPGQYLRQEWTTEELYLFNESVGESEPGMGVIRTTATSAWTMRISGTSYTPADLSQDVYTETEPADLGASFGDTSVAEERGRQQVGRLGFDSPMSFWSPLSPPLDVEGVSDLAQFYSAMPLESAAMVEWIRSHLGDDAPGWVDGKVGWVMIRLLAQNAGPSEARAAIYRALGTLPGSTVGELQGGQRTITFDSALAWDGGESTTRFTVTVNMKTGIVTSTTHTSELGESGVVPVDVPDIRTTYSEPVVSALP